MPHLDEHGNAPRIHILTTLSRRRGHIKHGVVQVVVEVISLLGRIALHAILLQRLRAHGNSTSVRTSQLPLQHALAEMLACCHQHAHV